MQTELNPAKWHDSLTPSAKLSSGVTQRHGGSDRSAIVPSGSACGCREGATVQFHRRSGRPGSRPRRFLRIDAGAFKPRLAKIHTAKIRLTEVAVAEIQPVGIQSS